MPGLGDIVQKAFYLGVGLASFAGEKAGTTLSQVRSQAQKLAEEMVDRGEMSTEEARKFIDDMVTKAQQQQAEVSGQPDKPAEPRKIEILDDDEEPVKGENKEADTLRSQVEALQEELRRLQKD
jgi:polyhydroxyalkanoate synthesis regulator phasin